MLHLHQVLGTQICKDTRRTRTYLAHHHLQLLPTMVLADVIHQCHDGHNCHDVPQSMHTIAAACGQV